MKILVIGAVIFAIIDIIGAFIAVAKAGRYQNGEDIIHASGNEPRGTQNNIRKGQR